MKAYAQYSDGIEIELEVKEPDPSDGTFCLFVPNGMANVVLSDKHDVWIRIVPK